VIAAASAQLSKFWFHRAIPVIKLSLLVSNQMEGQRNDELEKTSEGSSHGLILTFPLERLRYTMKIFTQNNHCPSWNTKQAPLKCKSSVLLLCQPARCLPLCPTITYDIQRYGECTHVLVIKQVTGLKS
jgi:hypothetical protein